MDFSVGDTVLNSEFECLFALWVLLLTRTLVSKHVIKMIDALETHITRVRHFSILVFCLSLRINFHDLITRHPVPTLNIGFLRFSRTTVELEILQDVRPLTILRIVVLCLPS